MILTHPMRSALQVLCCMALAAFAAGADREVYVYGPAPVHPAITAPMAAQLQVGRATISIDDAAQQVVDQAGGWVRGGLVPIWKTNGSGQNLDSNGLVTTDPAQYVLLRMEWDWFGVTMRTAGGVASTHIIVPTGTQRKVFVPDTTLKVGEYYWYETSQVRVIDIAHGTPFTSNGAATIFHRCDLYDQLTKTMRADVNDYDSANLDFGLVKTPSRTLMRAALVGGHFGVVVVESPREGFVFRGSSVLIDGQPHPDLYRWEGVAMVIPQGIRRPDNLIGWNIVEPSGTSTTWTANPTDRRPDAELPEPALTQYLALLNSTTVVVTVIDRAEAPTDETNALLDSVKSGRSGDALDQQNAGSVPGTFGSDSQYLRTVDGKLDVREQANYTDPALEDLRSEMKTMPDTLALQMQGEINGAEQLAPIAQAAPDADGFALLDAIQSVDAELIAQTPTSTTLRPRYTPRYAEMLPAGRTEAYHQGNNVPGDGNNPQYPLPDGAQDVGQPIYDLDGDGDLDRVYSDDPYGKGYDQIFFKWHTDDYLFEVKPSNQRYDCNFALYVQNSANPSGTRKLFYVGYDDMLWREKQVRKGIKLGINLYSYALKTHFEATGKKNEYRFALKYKGHTDPPQPPEPPPEPTSATVTWTNKSTVTMPDNTTTDVIVETGSETVFTWPADLYDESELLTATFSDPAFVPRAITGRPMAPCKFVRTVTPYTVVGAGSTPGTPTTTVVYFPADFRPENIAIEEPQAIPNAENAFMWDYHKESDGFPYNYHRGTSFGRHSRKAVIMNDAKVIARYGGDMPVQQLSTLIENGGTEFIVREVADTPKIYPNPGGDKDGWKARRSNVHGDFDDDTDIKPGGANVNLHGERTLDIVQGVGFYIYRGQKENYSSIAEQRNLLRKMWDYDLYQPRTVYTVLHMDNDENKPLLNTAVAPMSTSAEELYNVKDGILKEDMEKNGANVQKNAMRRGELKKTMWFFFSAARGREHEIAYALATPKETKLYCVEWDNVAQVQARFAGYDITFLSSDEEERKVKGEVITKIYGRTNIDARFDDGAIKGQFTQDGLKDLINAQPGKFIFLDVDMLYDKPACWVPKCALLDDQQYGDPRPEQWVVNHKMQFRHPMVIYYDDRWSSVVTAYGANSDPNVWCTKWNDYALPAVGDGSDLCRVAFEAWSTEAHLSSLYDRMNQAEYEAAKVGDVVLPPQPNPVNKPIEPTKPEEWTGGEIYPPTTVEVADKLRLWSAYDGPATVPVYDTNPVSLPNDPLDGYTWEWSPWVNGTTGTSTRISIDATSGAGTTVNVPAGCKVSVQYLGGPASLHTGQWAYHPGRYNNPDSSSDSNNRVVIRWSGGSAMPQNTASNMWTVDLPDAANSVNFQINDGGSRSNNDGVVWYYVRYGGLDAAAFTGKTPSQQFSMWDGSYEKYDPKTLGWLRERYSNSGFSGTPTVALWQDGGSDRLYPMGGNGKNRSAFLYGKVPNSASPGNNFRAYDSIRVYRLSDDVQIASRTWNGGTGDWTLPAGEVYVRVQNDDNDAGIFWWTQTGTFPNYTTTQYSIAPYAWPMTLGYYNLVRKGDLVARVQWYQNIYVERRDSLPKIRAYMEYKKKYQEYLDKKAKYDAWVASYPAALERYYQELATFQIAQTAYETYLAELARWQQVVDANRSAMERWKNYVRAREAWVYLVRVRMNDIGVNWSETEPTGEAFVFWRKQPEALECPECN